MRIDGSAVILSLLIFFGYLAIASAVDLTGTWESKYNFSGIEEVMTANIQQAGENLTGTFDVQSSTVDKYSGVIFGRINEDAIKAYYLSVVKREGKDPLVMITFTDGRIADQNTINGIYYVLTKNYKCLDCGSQDSDMSFLSAPYKATRI